jgi:D-glycero-alpha-D-manno-heptose-7-phosphate kinase
MIVSKTPLRMSYVGGGSDLPAYYREELGAVLSTTIDKYMYIAINKKFDGRIRISYTKTEDVGSINEIAHPLVREALKLTDIDGGIEVASMADIPSKGSGLGSSSSYTVGLLHALYAFKNKFVSKETLAYQACDIEINRCGEPIGKQDQYAAAYGGLNLIRFHPDESVSVDPVICAPSLLERLEASTLVFYTGLTRSASSVLAEQSRSSERPQAKALLRRMVQLAFDMKSELESGSVEYIGAMLDENWQLKAQLASGITSADIDGWYRRGMRAGAQGGKLLGAGAGGFLMFFASPDTHDAIAASLPELQRIRFGMDRAGTQIIFYQPTE